MLSKGIPVRLIAISSKAVSNHLTLLKSQLSVSSHVELVHLGIVRVASQRINALR